MKTAWPYGVSQKDPHKSVPPFSVTPPSTGQGRCDILPQRRAEQVYTEGLSKEPSKIMDTHTNSLMVGVLKKHRSPNETKSDEQRMLVLQYIKRLSKKIHMACCSLVLAVFKVVGKSQATKSNLHNFRYRCLVVALIDVSEVLSQTLHAWVMRGRKT